MESLVQVHRRHQQDQIQLRDELDQSLKELDEAEKRAPQLAQRFRYYQELRGYVNDLVECLDEKVGLQIHLNKFYFILVFFFFFFFNHFTLLIYINFILLCFFI